MYLWLLTLGDPIESLRENAQIFDCWWQSWLSTHLQSWVTHTFLACFGTTCQFEIEWVPDKMQWKYKEFNYKGDVKVDFWLRPTGKPKYPCKTYLNWKHKSSLDWSAKHDVGTTLHQFVSIFFQNLWPSQDFFPRTSFVLLASQEVS